MRIEELLRRCDDELAAGFALREACLRQQEAMVGGGAATVLAASDALREAAGRFRAAAESRQAAVVAMGAGVGLDAPADLPALAAALPGADAAAVRERRASLLALWEEIERLNRQNDVLARHSLAVIDLSLQRRVGGRAPTYGPKGRRALSARVLSKGG
jgi:hypothetical protein